MTRTYRISRGAAALYVGWALVWFGFFAVGLSFSHLPHKWSALEAGVFVVVLVVVLLIALAPALELASMPYQVRLRDDQDCEFVSLLHRKRVRVHQIRSITSDETDVDVRYDGGKVHMVSDGFDDLFIRLVQLNPAIDVKGWLRRTVE